MVKMYFPRRLSQTLQQALAQFPAVFVGGPRQAGKTTFLRKEFGQDAQYVSLDDPLERSFAREDANGFLDRFGDQRVILDEVQYVPELMPYLKLRIDRERQRYGRWLLTGSQQYQLMARLSESLAGRIAILELLPFSLREYPGTDTAQLEAVLWRGGYPEPALEPAKRELWLSSYLRTYVERDVRQLHNVQDLHAFEAFLGLCAARHGQELSQADLARSAGIAQPTVKSWLGVLEAAYLVVLLPPYFENFGKRLIKSPKLYFLDSALVCALTRQPSAASALAGAMGGALFEGWVVQEVRKVLAQRGLRGEMYFWRSQGGLEVDLLLPLHGRLVPVEIKLTATPSPHHLRPLRQFRQLAGDIAAPGLLVCRIPEPRPMPGGDLALPWQQFPSWLDDQLAPSAAP